MASPESLDERRNTNDRLKAVEGVIDRLNYGGGGDGGGIQNDRVNRLETRFEYMQQNLDSIVLNLNHLCKIIDHLPTRKDLESWRFHWFAVGIGIVTFIGGIVGGWSLINHYAASGTPNNPPIIFQIPATNFGGWCRS